MRIFKFLRWLGILDKNRISVVNIDAESHCVGVSKTILPSNYLRGYRRLAKSVTELENEYGSCSACKHALAFITWRCERYVNGLNCFYEPCYTKLQLTRRDINHEHWLPLPAAPNAPAVQTLRISLLKKYQGRLFVPEDGNNFRTEIQPTLSKHYR